MDPLKQGALDVVKRLVQAGYEALFAGGCVRDTLLGQDPQDYDIATSAKPQEIQTLFSRTKTVGAAFGVVLVVLPEGCYEVATFRKDGPYRDGRHPSTVEYLGAEEDAKRRDFTVNALFYDPLRDAVVDYVDGEEDLRAGVIRCVGDPDCRFEEDHLRLVRAVRFAARLDYAMDEKTLTSIQRHAHLIQKTSAERVRDELMKILTQGNVRRGIELLDETGLLAEILPEVVAMKGVDQPPEYHPEGDVFTHTLILLDLLKEPSACLALAGLLHDVGKPLTRTVTDRIRFNQHDKVGARETEKICKRLHFANGDTRRTVWLVEQHMRVATAPQMRESRRKRFVRHEDFRELLRLFRVDCLASHKKMETYNWLIDYIENLRPEEIEPEALLNGNDLIELGFEPGPLFADILKALEDAQLEGRLQSKKQALALIQRLWAPRDKAGKTRGA